jgi:UDP-glucose 4-epimerase
MKILITGGLGYIGGRLAQHLGDVYTPENIRLFTRKKETARMPSWASDFDVVTGDVLDEESLLTVCNGVDSIVHLAALNEIDSAADPKRALRVNGEGTLNTLNAAIENDVGRFIYFSTYHVYGLNAKGVINEDTLPLPIHPYAITHHVAEDFVRMANQTKGLSCTILRLSNGFGYPSDPFVNRWSLVFNNLCLQAALTDKIVLKGSGKQHRDFITLTDVCRAVEVMLKTTQLTTNQQDPLFNLGGEKSLSILDVANKVARHAGTMFGRTPKIIIGVDTGAVNEKPIKYEIDRIKMQGFQLISNIDEEITGTLKFCDENKEELKCHLM